MTSISQPIIMGILNVTPDSFSDGGKYLQSKDAIKQVEKLIDSGANIIDIGGESTRPGAVLISEEEELKRVIPVIYEIRKIFPDILISIDTYKSNVAQLAVNAGINMINDVSGLTMDPHMGKVAASANCPIVIMHNTGIPATKPPEDELESWRTGKMINEICKWLKKQINYAIKNGIKKENIIIDPGIGFGKSAREDLILIKNLKEFKSLDCPMLVGVSRKSFMKKLFSEDKTKEMTELAIKNGADIVRVH